ncbi:MAG: hypothetical protein ACK5UX_03460, partial [Burkholderiales bacterium]
MNWEMVAWVAIAGSLLVIIASFFFSAKADAVSAGGTPLADGESASTMHTLLEIAWPLLFIVSLGMLTFKEVMGFAAVLLTATTITGAIWLVDHLLLRKRRQSGTREPVLVEMAKSFFPVILIVVLLRSFLYEPFKIPS